MTQKQPGRAVLDRSSPLPLWAQITADLRDRIVGREFAQRFPTEAELMGDYGVSRHTVRESLRRLRADGLVVAERGRGTFVAQRYEQPLGTMYSLFRSIEERGVDQRSEVLRLEVTTDSRVAEELRLPPDADLVVLARRRFAGDEPLAVDTVWLPAVVAHPLLDADFTHTALYDELARRCGVHVDRGEERILPVVPTAEQRRMLGIPARTGAFFLTRHGAAGDRWLEYRETLVRGDRYGFVARWSASTTYSLDLVADR